MSGRVSPSSSAARLASRDAPLPAPVSSVALADCPRSWGTRSCRRAPRTPRPPRPARLGQGSDVKPCKNSNVVILTRWVWALDPYQVPFKDGDPQLVAEGGFPRVLVGPKGVSLNRVSLLGDVEVSPVDCHKTVVADVPVFSTFEVDLRRRRRRRGGVRTTRWRKKIDCSSRKYVEVRMVCGLWLGDRCWGPLNEDEHSAPSSSHCE